MKAGENLQGTTIDVQSESARPEGHGAGHNDWTKFAIISHVALLTVTMTLAQIISRASQPSIEAVTQLLAEGLGGAFLPLIAGWLGFRKSKSPARMFAWSWGLMALLILGLFSR